MRRPMSYEPCVTEAVRKFSADHAVDRRRVLIGGEGAGAMLAFEVATRAPGLFKDVVLIDGPIHPDTNVARVRRAASMGLAVQVVLDANAPWVGKPSSRSVESLAVDLRDWLDQCGFGERARVRVVDSSGDPDAVDRALVDAVRALAQRN
jgi:pimeloyl-ACP methyl ester carboxylesterase